MALIQLQADLQKLDALENRIAQERFVIHARAFAQSGTTETQPARPPSKVDDAGGSVLCSLFGF